ncbi:MAG TPA: lipid-A-disaccharide synthase [Vicinamibacteria bacterium]
MPRLLVSCGEPSGDLYAAELVRELLRREPTLEAFGLGGDRLAEQGARLLAHVRELAVVGLLEVVKHLSRLRAVFAGVLDEVDRRPPDAAVLIDYPDFNLRLARELRRRGIPVVYYVSPQVWAWRRGRVHAIRRDVSLMLVIFPFEEAIYREAGVRVRFVGHPLVDLVRPPDRSVFLARHGLDPGRRLVAVLPGSRPREVAHNLPPLAGAVERLARARPELQFVAVSAPTLPPGTLEAPLAPLGARVVSGEAHGALGSADLALVASGTATVEAALLGTPMIVVYRLAALTYVLGRPFVRVPHYAMVNLIAGRRLVPELIQRDFTPDRVAAEALALLEDPSRISAVREALAQVRDRLGPPGASGRAAEDVIQVMRERKKA